MNFRISNEFYRFTSPPLKVIEPPPFFVVGVIAALGRSWSPFAPKAQGGEAERERQLGDLTFGVSDWFCDFGGFPGFPSPFFCQGSLVDKLDWLGCVVFWGTVFVEMWMKFRCFVQSWNVIFCRLSRIYTCTWNGFYLEPLRDLGLHIKMRPLLFAERWKHTAQQYIQRRRLSDIW